MQVARKIGRGPFEEGVFYADDLDRAKRKLIRRWATDHGVESCSQSSFFWDHVRQIGKDGGLLVAFNAPFDLATIMPITRSAKKRKQKGRFLGGATEFPEPQRAHAYHGCHSRRR